MTGNNPNLDLVNINAHIKVSKGAKIRNRYNLVPHLTQDTNGKVKNSQLGTTNESHEVKFGQILSIRSQTIYPNEILTSVKRHNSITNVRKMMSSNPNNQYQCIYSINFVLKILSGNKLMTNGMTVGRNDGQPKSSIAPLFQSGL